MTRVLLHILVLFFLCVHPSSSRHTYIRNGITCLLCPPGSHKSAHCTANQPTRCTPCGFNYFMPIYNKASQCLKCRISCHVTHQEIVKNCTRTTNIVCQCKTGFYLKHRDHPSCKSHSFCPPGFGVVSAGTPDANTVCEKCNSGTFSKVYSKTKKCLNHTKCNNSYLFRGNSTHDAECSSNTARPSLGTVQPTTSSSIKHGNNTKELTTLPSKDTSENKTAGTNRGEVLTEGNIAAIIIVPLVTIGACYFCFRLCFYDRYKNVMSGKEDDDSSYGGEQQSLNQGQDEMELSEMSTTSGDGDAPTNQPGPSGSDRRVRTRSSSGSVLMRRSSSAKAFELKRSTSRTSGGSEEEALIEDDTPTTKSSSNGKRQNVVSDVGTTDQDSLEQVSRGSGHCNSNNAYVHSTEVFDGEPRKTVVDQQSSPLAWISPLGKVNEMKLADFFHKAGDVLHSDNWKRVMRALPATALTDQEINTIEYNKRLDGITEMKYQCFRLWQSKNPNEDVVKSIVETLEKVVGYQLEQLRNVKIIES